MNWLFLQLVDSAFPAGGFAHSNGLEAATVFRDGVSIERHLDELILQSGRAALPFVREACAAPDRLAELDGLCDATLTSHVANRASRAQGRALLSSASRIWPEHEAVQRISPPSAHHAPVLGALFGALDQSPRDAEAAYLHGIVRGVLSAAVRLGVVGPLEAQRIHTERAAACARILDTAGSIAPFDAAQPSPLLELYATLHDRLDARLFQS